MQANFVPEGRKRLIHFNDGREYHIKKQRYFMEHAGSKGSVSSAQMSSFVEEITPNEMGILAHYHRQLQKRSSGEKPVALSRNMKKVVNNFRSKWPWMLQDIPGLSVCLYIISRHLLCNKFVLHTCMQQVGDIWTQLLLKN